jgi:hypothetical protein
MIVSFWDTVKAMLAYHLTNIVISLSLILALGLLFWWLDNN